jgi:hypothetical protein
MQPIQKLGGRERFHVASISTRQLGGYNNGNVIQGFGPEASTDLVISILDLAIYSVGEQYRSTHSFHNSRRPCDTVNSPEPIHHWDLPHWLCLAAEQAVSRLILQIC